MDYRILGKTGLKISRMGFGGIPIQRIDAEGTKALMHKLLENGVNYIDTARGYTVSEEYLGIGLEGIREHFVLATKSMSRTAEAMAKDIDISLKNLRTDYIDLYQIHNAPPADVEKVCAPGGALEALTAAKKAGKIGHIGITAHSLETFRMALELPWVETIMFPYNIVEDQAKELIHACAEKDIGFIAMKPLAGGAIEDAVTALRYVCANPDVTVVIPGMADIAELNQNLAAVNDASPLSHEEEGKLRTIRDATDREIEAALRDAEVDVVVSYLPVGSEQATKWYVEQVLEAGCGFVNCIPVFIASAPYWNKRFAQRRLPIIGDDIKSQVGATIVHRALAKLFEDRGVELLRTYQLNFGGNMDFMNMLERTRLVSKKISKTQSVTSQIPHEMSKSDVQIGPSDHVPWLDDRKWAYIRLEGRSFGDTPLNAELKLEVWDSPNSAGIVIDAVRAAKIAKDRGIGGPVEAASAYLMKSPPKQLPDDVARARLETFIEG